MEENSSRKNERFEKFTSDANLIQDNESCVRQMGEFKNFQIHDPSKDEIVLTYRIDKNGVNVDYSSEPSEKLPKKSSPLFAGFNYVNSIVGSGVVGMPYAFQQSGFGLGLLFLTLVAIGMDYSLVILIKSAEMIEASTYHGLVQKSFGSNVYVLQILLQFLYPFICLVSYNIIVGDTLTKVLLRITGVSPVSVVMRREFVLTTVTLLITLPLSLYRNIANLAKISLSSVIMITLTSLAIIARAPSVKHQINSTEGVWSMANKNITSGVGIMCFAFMCHHTSFVIYNSLQDNSMEQWNKVTHRSVGISFIIMLTVGVTGFATFTGYTQGDIFENYCWDDDLINVFRALYAITLLFTFPIECFVTRNVIESTVFSGHQPTPFYRHFFITVAIAVLALLFSLSTDCLGVVLELNGIFCAVPLSFILPSMCYLRLNSGSMTNRQKWPPLALIISGGILMLWGLVTLLYNYNYRVSTCTHGEELEYCTSAVQNITK